MGVLTLVVLELVLDKVWRVLSGGKNGLSLIPQRLFERHVL